MLRSGAAPIGNLSRYDPDTLSASMKRGWSRNALLQRLATSLAPYEPYLRGAPGGLPFVLDAQTLRQGLNFTLITSIGAIDLLGAIAGGGDYAALEPRSIEMVLFGHRCLVVGLDALIDAKRAAGRPKDMEALAELEALRDESPQASE